MIKMSVSKFAEKYPLPGFYMDIRGAYCLNLGKNLLSVFTNGDTEALDICVDTISCRGYFDENLVWETPESEQEAIQTIQRLVKQYK